MDQDMWSWGSESAHINDLLIGAVIRQLGDRESLQDVHDLGPMLL